MTDQTLSFDLFPTTQITGPTGHATVPCEPVAAGIAITPYLDLGESTYQLGGGFAITHTTSGRLFTGGQACIECTRASARLLAALDVDWTAVDISSADTVRASVGGDLSKVTKAMRPFANCGQQVCQIDDDGEMETCEACGFAGTHAPHCISVVAPMVAGLNAQAAIR